MGASVDSAEEANASAIQAGAARTASSRPIKSKKVLITRRMTGISFVNIPKPRLGSKCPRTSASEQREPEIVIVIVIIFFLIRK